MDPLIKSQQITLIYQAHFDISSVRSGIEPERKLENVETKFERRSITKNHRYPCPTRCRTLRGYLGQEYRDDRCALAFAIDALLSDALFNEE